MNETTHSTNPIHPLGNMPRLYFPLWLASIIRYLCNSLLESDQHATTMQHSLGAGSFVHAAPDENFQTERARIGRPVADRIQSSRDFPTIVGESAGDRKRRQEFHDQAQIRTNNCFELTSAPTVLGLDNHQQQLLNPPRDLAKLIIR